MDHYAALGVSPDAKNAELNSAFKRKSNTINPVTNNNITRRHTALRNASKARQALKNSYNLLKNKGLRNQYNKTRKTEPSKKIDYTYVTERLSLPGPPGSRGYYEYFDVNSIIRFQRNINVLLKEGYTLHGDIIVTYGITRNLDKLNHSDNTIYHALTKGYEKNEYTKYKLLPVRINNLEIELKTTFLKDINKYLEEGWKLYHGPVELTLNRNVEDNRSAPRGYIYQALIM